MLLQRYGEIYFRSAVLHIPPCTPMYVSWPHQTAFSSFGSNSLNALEIMVHSFMNDNGAATSSHAQHSNGHSSLRSICVELRNRIEAFLQEDVQTERLRKVQTQTRISLRAIEEALERYTYVLGNVITVLEAPRAIGMTPRCPSSTMLTIWQIRSNLLLLQWRQRLPGSPHNIPLRPLHPSVPAVPPPINIYSSAAPVCRSRFLCRLVFRLLPPRSRPICER